MFFLNDSNWIWQYQCDGVFGPVWSRRTITESTLLESKMKACQPRPLRWIWRSYLSKVMTRGLRWFLLRLDDLSGLGVEVEWRISGSDKVWPWSETAALGWSGKCDVTRINIWVRAELLPGNPMVVGYEVSACKTIAWVAMVKWSQIQKTWVCIQSPVMFFLSSGLRWQEFNCTPACSNNALVVPK